jgi:hypothetical protein
MRCVSGPAARSCRCSCSNGRAIGGDDEILRFLDSAYDEARDADAHRAKALEKAGLPS